MAWPSTYAGRVIVNHLRHVMRSDDVLDRRPLSLDEVDENGTTWVRELIDQQTYANWQREQDDANFGDPQRKYDYRQADLAAEKARDLLDKADLSAREYEVIDLFFGLDGPAYGRGDWDDPEGLAEIAEMLGVTRQRVWTLYHDAIGKLRKVAGVEDPAEPHERKPLRPTEYDAARPYPRSYGTAGAGPETAPDLPKCL